MKNLVQINDWVKDWKLCLVCTHNGTPNERLTHNRTQSSIEILIICTIFTYFSNKFWPPRKKGWGRLLFIDPAGAPSPALGFFGCAHSWGGGIKIFPQNFFLGGKIKFFVPLSACPQGPRGEDIH